MITILIFAAIGLALSIFLTYNGYLNEAIDYILHGFLGIGIGTIIGLLVALLLPMETRIEEQRLNIESLQDNSGIHGSFFVGCGQVKDVMKYTFYYEDNGYFTMKQIDVENTRIRYSEGKPNCIIYRERLTESTINYFAIDNLDVSYVLEVPKGTIKNNYNLDAQ